MAIVTEEIQATYFGRHAGNRNQLVPDGVGFIGCMEGDASTTASYQQYEAIAGLNHEWYGHWLDPTGAIDQWQFRRPAVGFVVTGLTGKNILSAEIDIYSTSGCSFDVSMIMTNVTPQFTATNIYWNDPDTILDSKSSLGTNTWEVFTLDDPTLVNDRSDWLTLQILTTDYEVPHVSTTWTTTGYFYYLAMDSTRKPLLTVTYPTVPRQIWYS